MLFFLFGICILSDCSNENGSYVLKFKIHMDELTMMGILKLKESKERINNGEGKRNIVIDYINNAFNELNKDLEDYNVQVVGDYSMLMFEDLETNLDMTKLCAKRIMAVESTLRLVSKLSYPNTDGLGLRIIAFSCKAADVVQIPFFTLPSFTCGNLGFIFVLDPYTLKSQLKFIIKSFISGGRGALFPIKSKVYKSGLCNFVNKCAVNNDIIGSFMPSLVNARMNRN